MKFVATGVKRLEMMPDRTAVIDAENIGDDYHTLHDLYQHRMALNIALFHCLDALKYPVIKSKLHSDGTMFEGGYFIVMADMPHGQISYHYKLKHWDKFDIPEVDAAPRYDGHRALDVLSILEEIRG